MITVENFGFGPAARNRLSDASRPGLPGAVATLETIYYGLNQADLPVLAAIWSDQDVAQLNDAIGGVARSATEIADVYRHIFASGIDLRLTLADVLIYDLGETVLFAGNEFGSYRRNDGRRVPLSIRTSRLFGWAGTRHRWAQLHHHGSIDDPFSLADYQASVRH